MPPQVSQNPVGNTVVHTCIHTYPNNNVFYGFSSEKCGTSGILAVSRREQNEVDDFSKSTSRLKSTNRDSSKQDTNTFILKEHI